MDDLSLNYTKLNLFTDASGAHGFVLYLGPTGAMGNGLLIGNNRILQFWSLILLSLKSVPLGRSHE